MDVGANIGWHTILAATKVGQGGKVHAFEPSDLFSILSINTAHRRKIVHITKAACSSTRGKATLYFPEDYGSNDGIATLESGVASLRSVPVDAVRLDDLFEYRIDVLKIDVEGHEPEVLKGARRLLVSRLIGTVVFEDHCQSNSPAIELLSGLGYAIYSIGWDLLGLKLRPIGSFNDGLVTDAPNFVATLDEAHLRSLTASQGWKVLKRLDPG